MSSEGNSDNSGTVSSASNLPSFSSSVYVPNLSGSPMITSEKPPLAVSFSTVVAPIPAFKTCVEFYNVVDNLVHLKKDGIDNHGKAQSLIAEFGTLMPIGDRPAEQLIQREKFFAILFLTKLGPEFESIRNQVLGSNTVPGTTELFKLLLQVTSIPVTHTSTTEQSALVIQGGRG
nr:Retrovirus-related Pol polyprotein from transposon RE1 [Ipomoea batatas]